MIVLEFVPNAFWHAKRNNYIVHYQSALDVSIFLIYYLLLRKINIHFSLIFLQYLQIHTRTYCTIPHKFL